MKGVLYYQAPCSSEPIKCWLKADIYIRHRILTVAIEDSDFNVQFADVQFADVELDIDRAWLELHGYEILPNGKYRRAWINFFPGATTVKGLPYEGAHMLVWNAKSRKFEEYSE